MGAWEQALTRPTRLTPSRHQNSIHTACNKRCPLSVGGKSGASEMSQVAKLPSASDADKGQSRTVTALLIMRELILEGVLPSGKRISELSVAERTGISRTPIRAALQRLEEEGLVETIPSGG